eukprot:TRINITY_DN12758_c0_g1_i2.p1 TRINITY_DN12758_c0_g1~~TRINITY_DN12758_c0_g1_i2.p1  ORF type:complete len:371 (+),score=115.65 TRINITY_DN12758_c0_g1_i2:71-1114(+)
MPDDYMENDPMVLQRMVEFNVVPDDEVATSTIWTTSTNTMTSTTSSSSSSTMSLSSSSSTLPSFTTTGQFNNNNVTDHNNTNSDVFIVIRPLNQTLIPTTNNTIKISSENGDGDEEKNDVVIIVNIPIGSFNINSTTNLPHITLSATHVSLPLVQHHNNNNSSGGDGGDGLSFKVISPIVNLTITATASLLDDSTLTTTVISKFTRPITLTFILTNTSSSSSSIISFDDLSHYCLGYFDEFKRIWMCEDRALTIIKKDDGKVWLAGKTTHFTTFAILLSTSSSSPSSGTTNISNEDADHLTSSPNGYSNNTVVVAVSVVVCVVVVVAVGSFFVVLRKRRGTLMRTIS